MSLSPEIIEYPRIDLEEAFDTHCRNGNFVDARETIDMLSPAEIPLHMQRRRAMLGFHELAHAAQNAASEVDRLDYIELLLASQSDLSNEIDDTYGLLTEHLEQIVNETEICPEIVEERDRNGHLGETILSLLATRSTSFKLGDLPNNKETHSHDLPDSTHVFMQKMYNHNVNNQLYIPTIASKKEDVRGTDFYLYYPEVNYNLPIQMKTAIQPEDMERYPASTLLVDLKTLTGINQDSYQPEEGAYRNNHPLIRAMMHEIQGRATDQETHFINYATFRLQSYTAEHLKQFGPNSAPSNIFYSSESANY